MCDHVIYRPSRTLIQENLQKNFQNYIEKSARDCKFLVKISSSVGRYTGILSSYGIDVAPVLFKMKPQGRYF